MDLHAGKELRRRAGGHPGHAVPVQVLGLHRHQAVYAHVAGGPGHGADVLGQLGPKEDHGHPVQVDADGRLHACGVAPAWHHFSISGDSGKQEVSSVAVSG